MTTNTECYERLALDIVVPSKTNPRTHFDDAYLRELAGSIAEKGVIQPIVVRQVDAGSHKPMRFEIVAGECRYRASKIAGQEEIPAIVRLLSDEQVLELQLVENIHRKDLTALEQAVGYRALIKANPDKHSAASIAQKIGMSEAWVWDRLKLNDLVPEAKKILEAELMSVGHAILIARLKPEDQKRVIEFDDDSSTQFRGVGLWRSDAGFDFPDDRKTRGKYDGLKPCSVRELEHWIRDHIRFDVEHAAKAQPLVFETVATRVSEAEAKPGRGNKVIHITRDWQATDDVRKDDSWERVYGSRSWVRADGQEKSKTCEHSVLGVIVAGDGYGETFQVCVNKDKCTVHFGKVIKEREKNQKLRDAGQPKQAAKHEQAAAEREAREREKEKQAAADFDKLAKLLRTAVRLAAKKAPAALPAGLFAMVLSFHRLPRTTRPAGLQKAMLDAAVDRYFDSYMYRGHLTTYMAWAKALGVDVKALQKELEPKAAPATGSAAKAKSVKKGKVAA